MSLLRQTSAVAPAVSCRSTQKLAISRPFTAQRPRLVSQAPILLVQEPCSTANVESSPSSSVVARSLDPRGGSKSAGGPQFNAAYVAIFAAYAGLFLFKNPYIFAALSILTIIPQNSAITSLNSLVILFYESGLFMNFAEAVYCVRLMTWLSIICTLISFAIFV